MGKIFNPEKYGLLRCPDCKGEGKFSKNPYGVIVCSRCGGNGFIKKERKQLKKTRNGRNITEPVS